MEELLAARNARIDSTCRRCETGKAEKALKEESNRSGGIVKWRKNWEVFCIHQPCLQAYKVLFQKNHEANVWKITLPDCLVGICHYTQCGWPRYLSGQVKPSCGKV